MSDASEPDVSESDSPGPDIPEPDRLKAADLNQYPHNLFNDKTLSDVRIKLRHGLNVFGHKSILVRHSDWFFRAFTGKFPVASSGEICLDDEDDDPEAILAMIRHIYDFPYDCSYDAGPLLLTTITDLMFHINVFAAADKYDIHSLRVLIVEKFAQLMTHKWSASREEFCAAVQRLCGPEAVMFADKSLQTFTSKFCSTHILDLIKLDEFASMLEDNEPFAGRLLTVVLRNRTDLLMRTFKCTGCETVTDDSIKSRFIEKCICCGRDPIRILGFGPLEHYKDFLPL